MNPFCPGDDQDNPIHLGFGTYVYRGFNGVDLLLVTYNDAGVPTRSIRLFPTQVRDLVEAIKELDVFTPEPREEE